MLGLLAALFMPFWIGLLCTVLLSIFGTLVQCLINESWGLNSSLNADSYFGSSINIYSQTSLGYILSGIAKDVAFKFNPLLSLLAILMTVMMLITDLWFLSINVRKDDEYLG